MYVCKATDVDYIQTLVDRAYQEAKDALKRGNLPLALKLYSDAQDLKLQITILKGMK